MAITRKPKKEQTEKSHTGVNVAALINKGGSVAVDASNLEKEQGFPLRVPKKTFMRVDEAVKARRVKTSRNTWINEAILDLLEKEGF
jgi:hypothetical protein